jgi:hypothetical protein
VVHKDSVDKTVKKCFRAITKLPFKVKGATIQPCPLEVSALLARGYICKKRCGACCPKFSLDYLPSEDKPEGVTERFFEFNGRKIPVYSDFQKDNTGKHCKHVSSRNARCRIYPIRPFSCDFELVRCYVRPNMPSNKIAVAPFGRAWNLTRADGGKGTLCEILPPSEAAIQDTIRKLRRLQQWADHFGLAETWIPEIIEFLEATKGTKGDITLMP